MTVNVVETAYDVPLEIIDGWVRLSDGIWYNSGLNHLYIIKDMCPEAGNLPVTPEADRVFASK